MKREPSLFEFQHRPGWRIARHGQDDRAKPNNPSKGRTFTGGTWRSPLCFRSAALKGNASYAMLLESEQMFRPSTEKMLSAPEDNIQSARTNYTAGRVGFLRLIEAPRQFLSLTRVILPRVGRVLSPVDGDQSRGGRVL